MFTVPDTLDGLFGLSFLYLEIVTSSKLFLMFDELRFSRPMKNEGTVQLVSAETNHQDLFFFCMKFE